VNEHPNWKVARLDDFERRGSLIPVREFLGIKSFGMNVRLPGADGTLINEHDEAGSGQEEVYRALDWGEGWQANSEAMAAYGEQRYADALDAIRRGLERYPDNPGLNFNYACFASLAGEADDETFSRLRRSVELYEPFRRQARTDHDLAAVRDDPRFEEALR
jgi:hypothetical protein